MKAYPKRRNVYEYYPNNKGFVVDKFGNEIYARDCVGNQFYPKCYENVFAKDALGNFYYAKDIRGHEYYPVYKNRSLFIEDNFGIKLALYADGTQRYPTDSSGDEYYLKKEEKPYLLQRKNGEMYLAKTRNGHDMIPWNYMSEFIKEEPCIYTKDSAGNTIYLKESDVPQPFKALIRCLCHISVICPKTNGCNIKCY